MNEITLHGHKSTALAGVSTINITSFGEGNQYFTSVDRKNILSSVTVESGGEGYANNPIKLTSSGISSSKIKLTLITTGFPVENSLDIVLRDLLSVD